ncbi:MAG: N-acetyl-gamma-glutamyl-phosphate reductase [Flavobacteriales bacterium]|nr:N-acetyl-gamma-glutamyl-phosphate reductase [Flavobacteriales bacterium]
MIRVGIIGGAGYVAGELLRCLVHHPEVEVRFIHSRSHAGQAVGSVHQDLFAADLPAFTDAFGQEVDVVFLCLGHGQSRQALQEFNPKGNVRIIDLGNDFRLSETATFGDRAFVYGLPELNRERIIAADSIANPGCFATAIQLALLPLAAHGLLRKEVHVHALTGSTGAGQSFTETSHFSWRQNNVSIYKPFSHQHLSEIGERLHALQPSFEERLSFLPLRGDFTRGIFASAYMECEVNEATLVELYSDFYRDAPFTSVTPSSVHLKQVVNTNHCLLQVQQLDGRVLVTSVIDNLLKGAAGQAIQNMNLMFGLDEGTGLGLKANYF